MSLTRRQMVNEEYEPTRNEEYVLDVLEKRASNPLHIRETTGLNPQQIDYALNQLIAAGWVTKVTQGLYELNEDPRDGE